MIKILLLFSLLSLHSTEAQNSPKPTSPPTWQTLTGGEPLVVARGGFSGLFPESSKLANEVAIYNSVREVVVYCNLQVSKDGVGFCISDLRLENSTNIDSVFPKGRRNYTVNAQNLQAWFPIDYTSKQLSRISLIQSIYSRPSIYDNTMPLPTVEDVVRLNPPGFWLNVQNDMFYTEHKLSLSSFVQRAPGLKAADYISSPEINFLKTVANKLNRTTKLVFRFEETDTVEPTTKKTYGSLLKNLEYIKSFASGILIPKQYIWPINNDMYLEGPTIIVKDAHKAGLEVFAYGFSNDIPASYNYSYDPATEYLQFVDNSEFSVDGVLTDFPSTASAAIGCLAHSSNSEKAEGLLVISSNGASGVYAAGTDLAYQQAVIDGADIIDCTVQMSKDGVTICMRSPDLIDATDALKTFEDRASTVSEIKDNNGIFIFDLTWDEIRTLKPLLTSSINNAQAMPRNPASKNEGRIMTLQEFLEFAKQKSVSGVLINIKNAAYLASKRSLNITDAVSSALTHGNFDKQSTQKVLIQSDDSTVLSAFKNVPMYKKVFDIQKSAGGTPPKSVEEIKKFADAVTITRGSIIKTTADGFTAANTSIVKEMHAANLSIYVGIIRNEFTTIAFDFFSDPMVEIATYWMGSQVDGIITEYPRTAVRYLRSPCSNLGDNKGYKVLPAEPGALITLTAPQPQAPSMAPTGFRTVEGASNPPLYAPTKSFALIDQSIAPSRTNV